MNYGEFNNLVEEVIQFSKKFQSELTNNISNEIVIINDIKKAEHLAYDELFGEDEYNWKDIRELEMSAVWGIYYAMPENEKPKGLEELLEIIADNVRRSSFKYSIFYNDVVADLTNCAINRAINGKSSSFFEELFEIYQLGAFPCGWNGDYPEGKIVAFKLD
ncbi:hypothetical protein EXW45_17160 [Bacillus wiedmannii]|uniref:Cytoplasmic protein n=1 Tax=Bacillus cereus group sp. MS39 TaxID=3041344 RepID=A0AAU8FCB8_9BACI|nr:MULTISPECIES: hypothetical protein [Bacillus cereus group]KAA0788136.1 hypothetical protein DN394_16280 [Bacillus sp. BB081]MED2838179.1 hypothetical protein [Bacillus wiedmannii]PGC25786.1 hypothetical protein COM23_08325 [Bacillus wiedmannii]PHB57662.1 hypothetical protein COE92_05525 [Bacillus wiedmannii]QWH72967.1 hypothetical protein EXW45_17160 [Bacillus wiedmannii]